MLNASVKFEYEWIKMNKQLLFEYRLFSATLILNSHRRHSDVILDLTFTALERYHAMFGGVREKQCEVYTRG